MTYTIIPAFTAVTKAQRDGQIAHMEAELRLTISSARKRDLRAMILSAKQLRELGQ